jgi:hypothetical protein
MYISYPTGGTGKLTIDPDHVEAFVRYLEQAREKLRDIDDHGNEILQVVDAPGDDPFSPKAVDDILRVVGGESGSHAHANRKAQQVFQTMVDNLRASLTAYREQEARGTNRFPGNG